MGEVACFDEEEREQGCLFFCGKSPQLPLNFQRFIARFGRNYEEREQLKQRNLHLNRPRLNISITRAGFFSSVEPLCRRH